MRNKLKLHQLYGQVMREGLPFSCLVEWADQRLMMGNIDDAIIRLSLADSREQAISAVVALLGTSILLNEPTLLPEISILSQACVLGVYEQCIEYQADRVLIWCPYAQGQPVPEKIKPEWIRQLQAIFAATDAIKQGLFQYCTQDFPDILEAYREAECEDYAWQVVGICLDESGQQTVLTLMPNLDFAAEEYGLPDWPVDTLYIDLQCESDKIKISRIYD